LGYHFTAFFTSQHLELEKLQGNHNQIPMVTTYYMPLYRHLYICLAITLQK